MSYDEIRCKEVVSRKDHFCEWCNQKIIKGEKCWSRAYKFDGDFNCGHQHLECFQAMKDSDPFEISDGWEEGGNERGKPL